jgi:multiple sugar transport system substrate-binding protein
MSTSKKLSRRDFLRASALTAAGLVAAQCGAPATQAPPAATEAPAPAQEPTPTSPPAPAAEAVTLEFWECFGGIAPVVQSEKDAIARFAEENPDIKVNVVEVPFEQSHEKLVTAFVAGAGPDAFDATFVYKSEFVGAGYIEKLEPYIGELEQDLVPAALDDARYKGEAYALPANIDMYLQFYNKAIFDEAGRKPPENYDELLEIGLELTDSAKPLYMYPVKGGRHTHFQVLSVCMAYNGPGANQSIFDEEGNCLLNTEASVEGYQWWGDLLNVHHISPPTSPTEQIPETRQQFIAGTLATTWDFLGSVQQFDDGMGRENYGMVPQPSGPTGVYHPWGANGYYMYSGSQHKEETWRLLEHILSPEMNGEITRNWGGLPANTKAFDQEWLQDPHYEIPKEVILHPEWLQSVPTWLPEWTEVVTKVAIENNQGFLLGQQTAKESLDAQAAFLTEAQKKYLAGT